MRRPRRMVFCPTTADRLRLVAEAGTLEELPGRAATAGLGRVHGLGPEAEEELDHLAQSLASLDSALEDAGRRVVLAVDADADTVEVLDEPTGLVRLRPFDWTRVVAVFVDEEAALPAVATARAALVDDPTALAAAAPPPAVALLLEEHPLLWYLPTELDEVVPR